MAKIIQLDKTNFKFTKHNIIKTYLTKIIKNKKTLDNT